MGAEVDEKGVKVASKKRDIVNVKELRAETTAELEGT